MSIPRGLLALGAVMALLLVGCGGQDRGSVAQTDGVDETGQAAGEQQTGGIGEQARFTIASPVDGATVGSPVRLAMSVEDGLEVGPPEQGKMHFHAYIDGASDPVVCNTPVRSLDLPAGAHTIRVVLAQPGHSETGESATVRVTVSS